ncbi:MAG: efflux RND transporter periplasmic adaptor subunit [Rhodospirillales bacterium]
MRSSYIVAAVIAVAAAGWIASGQFGGTDRPAEASAPSAQAPVAAPLPAVRVRTLTAQTREREIIVNGRSEASRIIEVKSETDGRISELPAVKGSRLDAGAMLARIAVDDRNANLAESRALLRQREIEHQAAVQLAAKGYRPDIKVAESKALLDAARARVMRMEVEIGQTAVKAPFGGILNERHVELGDYLKKGDRIAQLVDLDPALIIGYVSERDIEHVRVGAPGAARLASGAAVEGRIRYKAAAADAATRTFRVELEVANPDLVVKHGQTAELRLPLGPMTAHFVSPAILTLDDAGVIGVKVVDAGDVARFMPVRLLSDQPDGVWLGGLPATVDVIAVGQEFVRDGQRVRPMRLPPGDGS